MSLVSIGFAALAGCAGLTERPVTPDPGPAAQTPAVDEAAARAARERERQARRAALIRSLLAGADSALADDRLTLPEHDNAYDRFAAVRLLDADNAEAEAGLQSVLLRYVQLIRSALRDGRVEEAQALLTRARDYFGDNPLLAEAQQHVAAAQEQAHQRLQVLNQQTLQDAEYPLPAAELSSRSQEMVEFLSRIAHRVQETNESVLIYARSDAEGRWIYRQLNEAVPEYRVRGDIRIAAQPSLQLLAPL